MYVIVCKWLCLCGCVCDCGCGCVYVVVCMWLCLCGCGCDCGCVCVLWLRSGREHLGLELAVEVRQGTLVVDGRG